MNDLISRSALIKAMENKYEVADKTGLNAVGLNCGFIITEKIIDEQPSVDAVPVVHAEWEDCGWVELDEHGGFTAYPHEGMRCSNCNRAFKKELLWTDNFCPNCGANMRKKVQE